MRSRQYVVQGATGCSVKGKTIANIPGGGLLFINIALRRPKLRIKNGL
jgi:hypothetical protein